MAPNQGLVVDGAQMRLLAQQVRGHRGGMPLEQIERILLEGSGSQWDARVIRAYFAAREDIRRIWETCRESAEPRSL